MAAWLPRRDEDSAAAHAINVTATESLVRSAALAGCRRVVLVSSVAAYGLPDHDVITEDSPWTPPSGICTGAPRRWGNKPPAAPRRRPASNWSSFDRAWSTDRVLRAGPWACTGWSGRAGAVRLGRSCLPGVRRRRGGHADPLRPLSRRPRGEAFTCVDRGIGWPQFFGYYGDMAGRAPRRVPVPVAGSSPSRPRCCLWESR